MTAAGVRIPKLRAFWEQFPGINSHEPGLEKMAGLRKGCIAAVTQNHECIVTATVSRGWLVMGWHVTGSDRGR